MSEILQEILNYTDAVLDRKIVTGKYVKLACQRFKKDLER